MTRDTVQQRADGASLAFVVDDAYQVVGVELRLDHDEQIITIPLQRTGLLLEGEDPLLPPPLPEETSVGDQSVTARLLRPPSCLRALTAPADPRFLHETVPYDRLRGPPQEPPVAAGVPTDAFDLSPPTVVGKRKAKAGASASERAPTDKIGSADGEHQACSDEVATVVARVLRRDLVPGGAVILKRLSAADAVEPTEMIVQVDGSNLADAAVRARVERALLDALQAHPLQADGEAKTTIMVRSRIARRADQRAVCLLEDLPTNHWNTGSRWQAHEERAGFTAVSAGWFAQGVAAERRLDACAEGSGPMPTLYARALSHAELERPRRGAGSRLLLAAIFAAFCLFPASMDAASTVPVGQTLAAVKTAARRAVGVVRGLFVAPDRAQQEARLGQSLARSADPAGRSARDAGCCVDAAGQATTVAPPPPSPPPPPPLVWASSDDEGAVTEELTGVQPIAHLDD